MILLRNKQGGLEDKVLQRGTGADSRSCDDLEVKFGQKP